MQTFRLQRLVVTTTAILALLLPAFSLAQTDILYDFSNSSGAGLNFGKTGTFNQEFALKLIPQVNYLYCGAKIKLYKVGSPVDSVRLRIYSAGTPPSFGTLITTPSAILGSTLQTTGELYSDFLFDNCIFLNKYYDYFFRLDRTGSLNDTNYYLADIKTSSIPVYAERWTLSFGSWLESTTSAVGFQLYGFNTLAGAGISEPSTTSYNFTDQNFGGLGTYLKDILAYLFIPSNDVLNQFTGLWDTVKMKPPIGYFTTAKNAFDNLTLASGSYYLTFSGLDSGDSPLAPLKTGLTWILWLMLGFWILHRIRQLDI